MQRIGTSSKRHGSTGRRPVVTTAVALAGVSLLALVGIQVAGRGVAAAVTLSTTDTGFSSLFSGTPRYEHFAPTEVASPGRLHQQVGQRLADEITTDLGLSKADTFTERQYLEFVTGKGVGGRPDAAKLVDESVRIFTNTTGRPLYSNIDGHITPSVLASYGLFVNTRGQLESLANSDAPTRQANSVIAPGGSMGTWCRNNGCDSFAREALQVGLCIGGRLRPRVTTDIGCRPVGHQ